MLSNVAVVDDEELEVRDVAIAYFRSVRYACTEGLKVISTLCGFIIHSLWLPEAEMRVLGLELIPHSNKAE